MSEGYYACTQCGYQWFEPEEIAPPDECVVCGDSRITGTEHETEQ
jgi:predicted Zn-ribbon and HTH transcriptional regulator